MFFFQSIIFPEISGLRDFGQKLAQNALERQKGPNLFKKRIAILPFKDSGEIARQNELGRTIQASLKTAFSNSAFFEVVDRDNLDTIVREIELGQSGLVKDATKLEAGNLQGIEWLLTGNVSEVAGSLQVDARVIDASTGTTLAALQQDFARESMLASAREYQWSAFQSRYGFSFAFEAGMIVTSRGYTEPMHWLSFTVAYRVWRYARVGVGAGRLQGIEVIIEDFSFGGGNINRRHHYEGYGPTLFADLIWPISPRFNATMRLQYLPLTTSTITQDLTDFPVYLNTGTANTLTNKRIQVTATNTEQAMPHLLIIAPSVEFLISRRISLTLRAHYTFATEYRPHIYDHGGFRQFSDNIDDNGTFEQLQSFNFSRTSTNEILTYNFSGVGYLAAVSLHI